MSVLKGRFDIDKQLPSLNQYTSANRANKYAGAKFKKEQEEYIASCINKALASGELQCFDEPVHIFIDWYEKDKRRDCDNIQSSQKFILDALQQQGIIPNDNRKYVKQVHHRVLDGGKITFVRVSIAEASVFDSLERKR